MSESIFTKIIKGEIPCHKIYEDDRVFAFLDIRPITTGHTLVVPKKQTDHFDELDGETYTHLFNVVKKVAVKQKEAFEAKRVCLRVEGFDVPHAHVHVYPCNHLADFYGDKNRALKEPDHKELSKIAEKLAING